MSCPCRVVPLLAIQHPYVPSNTSLAEIRGRCHELLPMTVVTLTCMPPSHTSPELRIVQYNKVIASLSFQISSRHSLAKHLSTRGLQPQTIRVDASCLHSSLGATLRLLNFLGYDVPLLRPQQQMSGPNIAFSPGSIQLSGVQHCCSYNASNGAIFKLSW
jgi:hypothetical protein